MAIKPIPTGYHTVTPLLLVKDAAKLIDFIVTAFNGVEKGRHEMDGKVTHAEVTIGDSVLMIGEASDRWPEVNAALYLYVKDTDSVYKQAVKAGGKSIREPKTEFYGDRSAGVEDNFGNQWWIATHVEDVSPEELEKRMKKAYQGSNSNS
jgi:PhnB protein